MNTKKAKILVGILLATISTLLLFGSHKVLANNEELQKAGNDIKATVKDAENALSNAAGGVAGAAKDVTDKAGKGLQDAGNAVKDGARDAGQEVQNSADKAGQNMRNATSYTAGRTNADAGTMAGNTTFWTWAIVLVAAAAIVALIWYYIKEQRSNEI